MRALRYGPKGPGALIWRSGVVLALAAVAIGVISAAQAGTSTKYYVASFAPAFAEPGVKHTYTLTITNCGPASAGCANLVSSQTLGSANVTIPAGYTAALAPGAGAVWSIDSGIVTFRAGKTPSLAPGASISVKLDVTPNQVGGSYCYAGGDGYAWPSRVKQSNNFSGTGNDFIRLGNDPTLTVASLVYTTQPTNSEIDPAKINDPTGVVVTVEDGCGKPQAGASGSLSVGMGKNPNASGGTLLGTTTVPLSSGAATFTTLSIDKPGSGYTLEASPETGNASLGYLSTVESTPFNVMTVCSTTNTPGCHTSNAATQVDAAIPPAGSTIGLSLGSPSEVAQCAGKTSLGSIASIVPDYKNPGIVVVTLTYGSGLATTPGVSSYIACVFKNGAWMALSSCTGQNGPPCVDSKQHSNNGPLVIVLKLPSDDPGSAGFE
jgi:hypothetical protein